MPGCGFGLGHLCLLPPLSSVLLLLWCCTGAASSVMGCRGSLPGWMGLDELQKSLLEAGGRLGAAGGAWCGAAPCWGERRAPRSLEQKGKPWAQKEISGQRAVQCGDTHVKHPGSRHRCYSSYPIRTARRAAGPHDEHKPCAVGTGHGAGRCAWLLGAASGVREALDVPLGRNLPLAPRSPGGNRAARRLLPQAAALCRRRGRILRPAVRLGAGGRRSAGLVVVALLIRFLK